MTEPVVHETHVKIGREPGRGAERTALIVVVLVLIAMLKPWGSPPAAETIAPRQPRVTPTERVLLGDHPCTGRSWLIQVDKRWTDRLVRSWLLTEAVEASGPTDPGIVFVTVASPKVLAIGYCRAVSDDVRPPTRLTIYRLGPPVELMMAEGITIPKSADPSENVLFRPVASRSPASASPASSGAPHIPESWGSGRYVLRVNGSNGYERWLGLEIRIIEPVPLG